MGDFLKLSPWSGGLGQQTLARALMDKLPRAPRVTHCESCMQDVKPFFGDLGFVLSFFLRD